MDDIAALLAALPLITLVIFTKNRSLWAWWMRTNLIGSVLIVAGIIVVRIGIYNLVSKNLDSLYAWHPLGPISCLHLPWLFVGLWEVDRIYDLAKFLGYHPHLRELMAFHDGMPFHGIENPFILCFANFLLLLPVFLVARWLKGRGDSREVRVDPLWRNGRVGLSFI